MLSARDRSLIKHLAGIMGISCIDFEFGVGTYRHDPSGVPTASYDPLERIDHAMETWRFVASREVHLSLWIVGHHLTEVMDMFTGERFLSGMPARAISEAVAKATGWQEPKQGTEE